ncbi:universal stress protein [Chryseobacterium sp. SC28]|uniref:universal stress protein n=1 Tax=Chryseobacterium sp. SC28 TaxID=2268028 RepID=UPI000F645F2C|nr:universal stress protein [Chryseobacterium sp. SC28]RRQ45726.1 universal stress protein [Chryseobacterium sp. SC28]
MKKILFLTDFSDIAEHAFIYALSLAEKINAELHILHIVPIIEAKDPDEMSNIHPLAKVFNDSLEDDEWEQFEIEAGKLEKIAKESNKLNVPVEFHFEKGIFLDTTSDYIAEKFIDVVVMGTAGANTIDKKLFGSHTAQLINLIDIPFLAVPERAVFVAMNTITVAVMLNANEYPIIQRLYQNSLKYNFNLNCVHVAESDKMAVAAKSKISKWLQEMGNDRLNVDIEVNIDVEKGLEKYVQRNDTNILCIIHRNLSYFQRMFRPNHSNRLLHDSKTALLIYNRKNK